MTVEGLSPNTLEAIQNDTNNEARRMRFFVFMAVDVLASQSDPASLAVLPVLGVDAAQLQVSGLFR